MLQLSLDLAFKSIAAPTGAAMPLPHRGPVVLTAAIGLLLLVVARALLVVVQARRQRHRGGVVVRVAGQARVKTVLIVLGGPDSLGEDR